MDYILAYSKSSRRVRELENKLAYTVAKYEKEIAGLKKEILAPKIKFTSKMGQFEKVLQVACMVCNVTPVGKQRITRLFPDANAAPTWATLSN